MRARWCRCVASLTVGIAHPCMAPCMLSCAPCVACMHDVVRVMCVWRGVGAGIVGPRPTCSSAVPVCVHCCPARQYYAVAGADIASRAPRIIARQPDIAARGHTARALVEPFPHASSLWALKDIPLYLDRSFSGTRLHCSDFRILRLWMFEYTQIPQIEKKA